MARSDLYGALAEALSQPSRTYRAFQEGVQGLENVGQGYQKGLDIEEKLRKRKLQQQTLLEALGGQVPSRLQPFANVTAEQVDPFSTLLKQGLEPDIDPIDQELRRDFILAKTEAARRSPVPKPMDPLDREIKETQLAKAKRAQGSDKSVQDAYKLYKTAKEGLLSGLGGSSTGPIVGRIPAFTAEQQIAKGSVAAMAPVLKQLFRVAGEGIFTDRDQQILLDMIPTRVEEPKARAAMLQNIDNIVKAKLGISDDSASADSSGGDPEAEAAIQRIMSSGEPEGKKQAAIAAIRARATGGR